MHPSCNYNNSEHFNKMYKTTQYVTHPTISQTLSSLMLMSMKTQENGHFDGCCGTLNAFTNFVTIIRFRYKHLMPLLNSKTAAKATKIHILMYMVSNSW